MSFAALNVLRFFLAWAIGFSSLYLMAVIFEPKRPRVRRRDRNPLICRGCGYDLRATPTRCPECGRVRAVS